MTVTQSSAAAVLTESSVWGLLTLTVIPAMLLALRYGLRHGIPIPWLDIPLMCALHGTAMALGFGGCGMIGWRLIQRRDDDSAS